MSSSMSCNVPTRAPSGRGFRGSWEVCIPGTVFTGDSDLLRALRHGSGVVWLTKVSLGG